MGTWIKSGDTMKGNEFVVYGQFHDKQSAVDFMESLKIFFNIEEE